MYNPDRDLQEVISEPVVSLSAMLESGLVPSGGTDKDDWLDDSLSEDTSHVLGRIVDPFDALELNKAMERFESEERKGSEKRASDKAFKEAVQKAVSEATAQN